MLRPQPFFITEYFEERSFLWFGEAIVGLCGKGAIGWCSFGKRSFFIMREAIVLPYKYSR